MKRKYYIFILILFFPSLLSAGNYNSIVAWRAGVFYNYTQGYKFSLSGEWREVIKSESPRRFYIEKRNSKFELFSFLLSKSSFNKKALKVLSEDIVKDYHFVSLKVNNNLGWNIRKAEIIMSKGKSDLLHKDKSEDFIYLLLYVIPYKNKLVSIGVIKKDKTNFNELDSSYFFNSILSVQNYPALQNLMSKWLLAEKKTVGIKFKYPYPLLMPGREFVSKQDKKVRIIILQNRYKMFCNSYILVKRDLSFVNLRWEFELWKKEFLDKELTADLSDSRSSDSNENKVKIIYKKINKKEILVEISYRKENANVYKKVFLKNLGKEMVLFHIQSPVWRILDKENLFPKIFQSIELSDIKEAKYLHNNVKPIQLNLDGRKISLVFPNDNWTELKEEEREKMDWEAVNAFQSKKDNMKLLIYTEKILASRDLYFYQSIALLKWKQKGDKLKVMPALALPYKNTFWKIRKKQGDKVLYILLIKKGNSFYQFVFFHQKKKVPKDTKITLRGGTVIKDNTKIINMQLERKLFSILNSIKL